MAEGCPTCGRPWPAAEQALSLRAGGMAVADIAQETGLSERQVQRLLKEAGLSQGRGRPPKPPK